MIKKYTDIIGWFDFMDIYDKAIKEANSGDAFLEVGCFMGKSTRYLIDKIRESKKKIKVFVIDIFEPECKHHEDLINEVVNNGDLREIFVSNMRDVSMDELGIMRGKSQEVHRKFTDGGFFMVFIDAAHDYESVKADMNNFYPKLKSGGIFAGHDMDEPTAGVGQAVREFCNENNVTFSTSVCSWIIRKP